MQVGTRRRECLTNFPKVMERTEGVALGGLRAQDPENSYSDLFGLCLPILRSDGRAWEEMAAVALARAAPSVLQTDSTPRQCV